MALVTKYEKVNSNNIKRWLENSVLNKQDLQSKRSDYQTMINLTNNQKTILIEEFNLFSSISDFETYFQTKYDEIDDLLDLFNNSTTEVEIDFIDE